MIAGLHLCAVMTAEMTAVKTAGAVAEVGVAHPVPNPEGMTAAHLCVAMTEADPVTDPEGVIIVDPEMVPEMKDPGKVELGNLVEVEVNTT